MASDQYCVSFSAESPTSGRVTASDYRSYHNSTAAPILADWAGPCVHSGWRPGGAGKWDWHLGHSRSRA